MTHPVNLWKPNMLETQVMFSKVNYPEFYFLTKNYKRWMHLRSNITYECFLSQSVSVLSSFKCSQWWVMYLKTTFNWDIIFQSKRISWKGWVIPNDFVHDFWKKYPRGAYFFAHAPKVSNKTYKNCVTKSPILKAFKLSSCRLVVFIDMNKNMLTEGNNFKTLLK